MIIDDNKKDATPEVAQEAPKVSKPHKAEVAAPAPVAPVAAPADINALLVALLEQSRIAAAREARLAKAEEEEEHRKQVRKERYALNRQGEDTGVKERQATCKHLKGGKFRMKTASKDYAVNLHRFIDNTQYVRCILCKMKWYPTDTAQRIVRGGKVLVNHTNKGWAEALMMVGDSTNTPTSSEIPSTSWSKIQKEEDIPDTSSVITR